MVGKRRLRFISLRKGRGKRMKTKGFRERRKGERREEAQREFYNSHQRGESKRVLWWVWVWGKKGEKVSDEEKRV